MTQEAMRSALEALKETAQSLAWLSSGECRGFSNNLLSSREALEMARSAISQLSKALEDGGEAREGWKLVPIEATAAMVAAVSGYSKDQLAAHATWDVMVKAAPDASKGSKP